MDLNEGQKSLGRTVVTAEECEKLPRPWILPLFFLHAARLYAVRAAFFMLLALRHDGGAEAGSQVFG
jgi:hypothetical protein